eukprot:gene642-359_t
MKYQHENEEAKYNNEGGAEGVVAVVVRGVEDLEEKYPSTKELNAW